MEVQTDAVDGVHPVPDAAHRVPQRTLYREQHPQILDPHVYVGAAHGTGVAGAEPFAGASSGLQQR